MATEVISVDSSKIEVVHRADYTWPIVGMAATILYALMLTGSQNGCWGALLVFVFGGVSLYYLVVIRNYRSLIDQATQTILHEDGGVLGSSALANTSTYSFSEVQWIEIKRIARRNGDRFQVRMRLGSGLTRNISGADLGLSEGQRVAERVSEHIGLSITPRGID